MASCSESTAATVTARTSIAQVVHVPLLVVPPRGTASGRTVATPVSLRDLPATVVELLGLGQRVAVPRPFARQVLGAPPTTVPEQDDFLLTETADELSKVPIGSTRARPSCTAEKSTSATRTAAKSSTTSRPTRPNRPT